MAWTTPTARSGPITLDEVADAPDVDDLYLAGTFDALGKASTASIRGCPPQVRLRIQTVNGAILRVFYKRVRLGTLTYYQSNKANSSLIYQWTIYKRAEIAMFLVQFEHLTMFRKKLLGTVRDFIEIQDINAQLRVQLKTLRWDAFAEIEATQDEIERNVELLRALEDDIVRLNYLET